MSFILDALKKSETDRQRQSGPSLFEVKVPPPRRTLPIWAVAIAVLLGINVIVVSWMLLRHPSEQEPATAHAAAAGTAPGTAVSAASVRAVPLAIPGGRAPGPDVVSGPGTASGRTSIGAAGGQIAPPSTSASSTPPPAATPATPLSSANDQSTAPQSSVITPSDYAPAVEPAAQGSGAPGGTTDDLPLYRQIIASANLPSLHLDLHVFAKRPRDRFVMINMHRLQEGDTLPNGVQVEAIRPDGVVLSYRGTRFLLPRN
ncbi:MAG: general secretion pathway protein GspB [Steroidobacteraceae bacterium]